MDDKIYNLYTEIGKQAQKLFNLGMNDQQAIKYLKELGTEVTDRVEIVIMCEYTLYQAQAAR